jgi:diamine N-acetyltransferase
VAILENDLIRLRAPELSDLDLLYKWENNEEVWPISNTLTPFSRELLKKYLNNAHEDIFQARQLMLMIDVRKDNDLAVETIGAIDLFNFEPHHLRAGVGILIGDNEQRGKGYAGQALGILIDYAFKVLGLHQLYCNVFTNNETSLNLFKSKGFKIIAEKKDWIKLGDKWQNEYLMQLIWNS